jgi:hypothetical protein
VLDYSFELGGLFVNPTLEVSGYLSDGTDRVNFEISTSAPAWATGGTARLDATLDLVGKDFKVTTSLEANAGATDGSGEVAVKIEGGDDIIEIDSETASGQVDVTVKVNGAVFATATGPAGNPVIKGEGGRDLTQDEWAALAQLVEFTNGVFGLLGGLLAPAGALLALALGLT